MAGFRLAEKVIIKRGFVNLNRAIQGFRLEFEGTPVDLAHSLRRTTQRQGCSRLEPLGDEL